MTSFGGEFSVDEDSVQGCIFWGCCCLRLLSCDGPSSDVDSCGRLMFEGALVVSLLGSCVGCCLWILVVLLGGSVVVISVVGVGVSDVGVVSVGGAGVSGGGVGEVLVEHWLA